MSVFDKLLLYFRAVFVNRAIREFGSVGCLALEMRLTQELILKAAKDLWKHPEVLAQEAVEMGNVNLFLVNKGVTP